MFRRSIDGEADLQAEIAAVAGQIGDGDQVGADPAHLDRGGRQDQDRRRIAAGDQFKSTEQHGAEHKRHPAGADEASSPQGGEARLAGGEEFPEDFKESPGQTYIRLPGACFNDALADLYPVAIRCLHTDPAGLW